MRITKMKKITLNSLLHLSLIAVLLTACSKEEDTKPQFQNGNDRLSIRLKAAINIGGVLYDSIPANFTITSWDVNNIAHKKDTALNPGTHVIYLPKSAVRYILKMQKWGVTYEKILNQAEVTEGALYQLRAHKDAKKLQWVTEEIFKNGVPILSAKQHFIYDAQGRITEVHAFAPNPNGGALVSGSKDLFLYDGNELWVNSVRKSDEVIYSHSAYKFDGLGRTIQTKHQYLTENHVYTNQYTSEGIVMLFGENASNTNGSRIALKFIGGNRVEEETIITNSPTTVKKYSYDFNINPYAVIKMPSMYFEHSSKNNVLTEFWEGYNRFINEYAYDSDGYVTEVTTKIRTNTGEYVHYSRTIFTY